MIRWGVENELHTFLGQAQLGAMCTLFNSDYVVCSSKKTMFMSLNKISKTSSNIYTTIIFAEYLDMVFAVDVGFCRLSAFQPRNPTDFYVKDFPLGQQWVHQLYYDRTHNFLITVGNDIKIWKISRNRFVSCPEERLLLELQSTIPSTSFVCDLNEIYVDEPRSRLIIPSSHGLIVYHYDGQVAANHPNMCLDKFNSVCLRIAPVKHERMKEKFKKELNVIPLNLYKRLFTADTEGNLLLWHRSGQLLHRYDERIQSIVFSKFVTPEFIILVDKMSKIYIVDVKAFHIVLVDDKIQKKPDRVYLLRNPDRLAISSVNEIFIFRINTLWTLWYHPISKAFSFNRYTSPNIMTRFGFFSDDGFFRLISPKGSYLIASAAIKKCATPRYVAYDPTCDDDLCIMALDDSTIQFFKIVDENSSQILTENDDKYENKDKKPQLLGRIKNEQEEKENQNEETKEDDIKNNNNKNETNKDEKENKEDKKEEDENEKYEVNEDDQVRRLMMNEDQNERTIKETDDFHIVDYIKSSSQILVMAKVFAEKEWALISLGPQGDLNVFEWKTWERKKRLFVDHTKPRYAFWDRPNNTLIIISQKKLAIISLETFIFNYNEFFKEPQYAAYENGLLITYYKEGRTCYYEITNKTVKKVTDINIYDKVVSLTLQYGIHIFVFDNCTISIGDRDNFSTFKIQLPFQPTCVSFKNPISMDLLIAIDNEVMILPLSRYCSYIEPNFCYVDDYDGRKIDPRVFYKSRNSKRSHSHGNKKYADASTGTGDANDDYDSNSSDVGDYDDINSDSDDDEFTDDEEYNKKRRIKRYKKQLKRGIFKSRDFKTVTKPFFDAEADFEENFDYKAASFQPPPPRQIKTISSMFTPKDDNKNQPKPRDPVYVIAGKIKSGQKASIYRFSGKGLNTEEEEFEEEEEEADENGDRIKGMFDLLEIKELTFDKETQTDETFVSKMKEREAEERRKQLLAKIAEMNKKNRKKKNKGDGESGEDENGTTDNETESGFDSDDSRYGKGKGKKGKGGKGGKGGKKGKGKNGDDDTDGTSMESKSNKSRISSLSKLSSLSKNGRNGRNNGKNKDKNGSKSGKSKSGGSDLNSGLSNQNMPGDLYFNSSADAIGNKKNVLHPDGYDGSDGNNRRGGRNGKGNGGYGDGNGDFSRTPRRGRNGYGNGKGGPNGYGSGYGANGADGGDGSNNLFDGYDKLGSLPSKIYRRIDYDDAAINLDGRSLFDRLNGHSPSCKCRECCDPNYKNLHKDVHLPSYRLIEGQESCGCNHDHDHEHDHEHTHGNSYIYGNDPYIGITIENFPADTEFKDQTILCGHDNPPLEEKTEIELLPVVPPKTPKKKKKMPIVIPPDRLSFSSRRSRPPPISTMNTNQMTPQQKPNSCRINQYDGQGVLITQQDGGEAFASDNESEVSRRPQSSRTILATPEKEALWQTPDTAFGNNSSFSQFRFSASAKSNYSSSTPNSARSNQPNSSANSSASSSARQSARLSLRDSYMMEFENSSTSPRNLSKPVLHDEGYSGYGTGFGYEFAQKAPDLRNTETVRIYSHTPTSTRRSGEVLPPLPKVV